MSLRTVTFYREQQKSRRTFVRTANQRWTLRSATELVLNNTQDESKTQRQLFLGENTGKSPQNRLNTFDPELPKTATSEKC
jgi:hypothetical protein